MTGSEAKMDRTKILFLFALKPEPSVDFVSCSESVENKSVLIIFILVPPHLGIAASVPGSDRGQE